MEGQRESEGWGVGEDEGGGGGESLKYNTAKDDGSNKVKTSRSVVVKAGGKSDKQVNLRVEEK